MRVPSVAAALLAALALAGCGSERARPGAPVLPGSELEPGAARSLPAQGLVVARRQGLVLVGLDGRVAGHLTGFSVDVLAEQGRHDRLVYVRDGAGREWALGADGARRAARPAAVPYPPGYDGCDDAGGGYVVCGRPGPRQTSRVERREADGRLRPVVGPAIRTAAGVVGRWTGVRPSPDGRTLLLQWSAECELPIAYLAASSGAGLRPLVRPPATSVALGWTTRGRVLVSVARGDCGRRADAAAYAVDPRSGARTLVARGEAYLWGDASAAG